jgi:hypothetical protein
MLKRKRGGYVYEKNICCICSQICYNRKDLGIHMEKEHILQKDRKGKAREASIEV